ncbi:MaoC/PaaZ C-terminal domain-containing protein [Loigolactobacillus rennini]|uniref:Dehydratase n=1 Tax=Loigolactobacillus rennini DSM 20253 TaxID=1423796 RepID=A0A0R2CYZ9_9LACO|nr:MaoC/PaaZ C-terminal domain-containing protein [Loigolactobacillus rennini]KRM92998.1 dehydratase [Loigolactobacillus rennini DSM 20253]
MSATNYQLGKTLSTIKEGDSLTVTQAIEERDIFLYLGLTNDNNPLFTQADYAAQTDYQHAIVPQILLTGIITSAISKHLPGPGSNVVNLSLNFMQPVFHGVTLTFTFNVIRVDKARELVTIAVTAKDAHQTKVLDAEVLVAPPK